MHDKAVFWCAWPAAILGALLYAGEILLTAMTSSGLTVLSATIVSVLLMVPLIFLMLLIFSSLLTWFSGWALLNFTKEWPVFPRKIFIIFIVFCAMIIMSLLGDAFLFSSLPFVDRVAHAIWWPVGGLSNVWLYFSLFNPSVYGATSSDDSTTSIP